MASPLPAFKEACLAPDHDYVTAYLIGSPNPGILEVYSLSLSDPKAVTVSQKTQETTSAWDPKLPKYCFSNPPEVGLASSRMGITAVQLGDAKNSNALMAAFGPNGSPGSVAAIPAVASATNRVFTLSGVYSFNELLSVYTKSQWVALRVDMTNAAAYQTSLSSLSNISSVNPMVAVGTYRGHMFERTSGYSIVFDSSSNGMAYPIVGNATTSNTDGFLSSVDKPVSVITSGIKLTNNSVPVTMSGTAYILDKSNSSTIVIYSITPSLSMELSEVKASGDIPLYSGSGSLAATSLNKLIVVYSLTSDNTPRVHVFNTATGAWSAAAMAPPSTMEKSNSTLVISIVVWVLALGIIACVLKKFWYCFKGCFLCAKGSRNNSNGGSDGGGDVAVLPVEEPVKPQQQVPLEKVNQRPDSVSPFPQQMATPYPQHIGAAPFPQQMATPYPQHIDAAPFPQQMATPYPQHIAAAPFPQSSTSAPYPSNITAPFPEPMAAPYPQHVVAPFPDQVAFPPPQHLDHSPQAQQYVANSDSITMMGPGEQGNGNTSQAHWPAQPPPSPLPASANQYTSSSLQYPPSPRLHPSP